MYPVAELQQQCQRSLCLQPVCQRWLSSYYGTSLWLWQFIWRDHKFEVFATSSLCVWNQMPWRNLQTRVSHRGFLSFYDSIDCQNQWSVDRFLQKPFWYFQRIFSSLYTLAALEVSVMPRLFLAIPRSPFLGKGRMKPFVHLFIVFWLYTALLNRSSKSLNLLVFHISGVISSWPAAFHFLIFVCTTLRSWLKCPSLVSCWF